MRVRLKLAIKLKESDIKEIERVKSKGNVPEHIAIIMDGNGRWAKKRNLPRIAGHHQGVESVRQVVETCIGLGVKILTLYAFSTENWKRPQDEVTTLMRLMVKSLQNETDELNSNNIRLVSIGNKDSLPKIVQDELNTAIKKTANNSKMVLNLALSYSGRWELVEAIKNISKEVLSNKLNPNEITEELVSNHLTTAGLQDPDLMIRTSGEFRISNFLLWQLAYSEIFISNVLWPDFKCSNLLEAIENFQSRERRFGLVSEQLSKNSNSVNNVKTHSKKAV